jgi:tetratricopeptide (TPR) repeat protein
VQPAMSYSGDEQGTKLAHAVVKHLRDRGIVVLWDEDLLLNSPPSVQESLLKAFSEASVVLLVLSPEYLRRFAQGDDSSAHRGVLFESRILLQRYYNHTRGELCPLVPVADMTLSVDAAPYLLNSLLFSRVDPDSGDGFDALASRIERIAGAVPSMRSADDDHAGEAVPPDRGSRRSMRAVVCDLEAAVPSAQGAADLVQEWLEFSQDADISATEFVSAFPAAERIIKAAGDVELMRQVDDACMRQLASEPLIDVDKQMKAQILIDGRAWHLRRCGRLMVAMEAVENGMTLAKELQDYRAVHRGHRHLAHLYRRRAEIGKDQIRDLESAEKHAKVAWDYFGKQSQADADIAASIYVLARIEYVRFRLTGARSALRRAASQAERATDMFPQDRAREEIELLLLRCEIATANGRIADAQRCLDRTVELLDPCGDQGASYTRLRGRAHQARAHIYYRQDAGLRARTKREAEAALAIYRKLGLSVATAECEWFLLRGNAVLARLHGRDVTLLERQCADHRIRIRAAKMFADQLDEGSVPYLGRRKALQRIIRRLTED